MFLRVSHGTNSAEKGLLNICSKPELNKFVNADYRRLSGNVTNVNTFFKYANVKSQGAIETFADALNCDDNMQTFLNALEKQAKSLGTKKSGLFYKLIYNNIHQKIKSNSNWSNEDGTLKQFEKELRKFLLAKKGQDIEETKSPEGLDRLSDNEKTDKQNRRKNNSNIVEKLKSGRLSNRLKVFMALVLWKYVTDKIKELNQQPQSPTTTTAATGPKPEPKPEPESEPEFKPEPNHEPATTTTNASEPKPEPEPEPEIIPDDTILATDDRYFFYPKKEDTDQLIREIKAHPEDFEKYINGITEQVKAYETKEDLQFFVP